MSLGLLDRVGRRVGLWASGSRVGMGHDTGVVVSLPFEGLVLPGFVAMPPPPPFGTVVCGGVAMRGVGVGVCGLWGCDV